MAGLYLLMMVLLPFLHLSSHAPENETVAQHHCCSQEHGQENHSGEDSEHGDTAHDSCSLCQLLVLSTDTPQTAIQLHVNFSLLPTFEERELILFSAQPLMHQARAPPFMTV